MSWTPAAFPPEPTMKSCGGRLSTDFLVIAIAAVLALVIFLVDLLFPLGVAGGVPYVALVLLVVLRHKRRAVV